MFFLTYVSTATRPFSKTDLSELMTESHENNARLGLTGMLLYKDGNFMQVLEGEEGDVRALYQKISSTVSRRAASTYPRKASSPSGRDS